VHLHLDQIDGLRVFDLIDRQFVTEDSPGNFSFRVTHELDLHFRFVAKVALSAGYFVYGDLFRTAVQHDTLRKVMHHRWGDPDEHLRDLDVWADSMLYQHDDIRLKLIRTLCRASSPYSIVGLVPGKNSLRVFVGILGDYIGMLTVPADTSAFPNEGQFRLGHVLQCHPRQGIARLSFMDTMIQIRKNFEHLFYKGSNV
jgi:hypothetical protein